MCEQDIPSVVLSESQTIRLDHQPLLHTPSAQPVRSTVCLTDCTLSVHQPAIPCAQQPSKASQSVEARRQKLGETLPGTWAPSRPKSKETLPSIWAPPDPRIRLILVPGTQDPSRPNALSQINLLPEIFITYDEMSRNANNSETNAKKLITRPIMTVTSPNLPHIALTYTKMRYDNFFDHTYPPSWS